MVWSLSVGRECSPTSFSVAFELDSYLNEGTRFLAVCGGQAAPSTSSLQHLKKARRCLCSCTSVRGIVVRAAASRRPTDFMSDSLFTLLPFVVTIFALALAFVLLRRAPFSFSAQAEVDSFLKYLRRLLAKKTKKGGRGNQWEGEAKTLAAGLVRDFMAPESGDDEAGAAQRRTLYRGMVLASRMAAILYAPNGTHAKLLVSAGGDGKCVRLFRRLCRLVSLLCLGR